MKRPADRSLREELARKHACYVLITCDDPTKDGKMHVEMSYQGDAALAAYILQGAQLHLDDIEMESFLSPSKSDRIHLLDA